MLDNLTNEEVVEITKLIDSYLDLGPHTPIIDVFDFTVGKLKFKERINNELILKTLPKLFKYLQNKDIIPPNFSHPKFSS